MMYRSFGRPEGEGWMTATIWLTFVYLPLLPLRRERVRLLRDEYSSWGVQASASQQFQIAGNSPISFLDVVKTYVFGWVLFPVLLVWPIILAVYLGSLTGRREEAPWWPFALMMGSLVVALFVTMEVKRRRFQESMQAAEEERRRSE